MSAGGYWYENSCHKDQSPNYVNTAKLVSDWYFRINTDANNYFTQLYIFDSNTISEDPDGSGIFTIKGRDEDFDGVTGGYVPAKNNYRMYVTKTEFDILYEFTFSKTNTKDVTGCYYEIDKTDGTRGPCLSTTGSRLKP